MHRCYILVCFLCFSEINTPNDWGISMQIQCACVHVLQIAQQFNERYFFNKYRVQEAYETALSFGDYKLVASLDLWIVCSVHIRKDKCMQLPCVFK